jgi:ATP-dependent exoDNAse (exonuclease V) alpha subunit
MSIALSPDQQQALYEIIDFLADKGKGEMVLGGSAGTGKTFLTRYILNKVQDTSEFKAGKLLACNKEKRLPVHLTSTTNKAASVLHEATGHYVNTIHRLLGLVVYKDKQTGKTVLKRTKRSKVIERSIIVIDEAGMIDDALLEKIRDLTYECKVLFIGDPYQLAPVFKTACPVFLNVPDQVYLTQAHRQAATSSIIQFAEGFKVALDTGKFPQIASLGHDVIHMNADAFYQEINKKFIGDHHRDYARIVAWSNNKIHKYNKTIRALNKLPTHWTIGEFALSNTPLHYCGGIVVPTDGLVEIIDIGPVESYEDILCRKIEYETNNGDRYSIHQAEDQIEVSHLINHFKKKEMWREKYIVEEFFSDFRPMYANTCHKAQGSTYEYVFIDLNDIGRNTRNNDIARLLYTAVTRASNTVYLYGNLPLRLYK